MKNKSVLILLLLSLLFIGLNSYAYDNYSEDACNYTWDVNKKILCNEATYFYRFSDIESTPLKDLKKHSKEIPFLPLYKEAFDFLSWWKAFFKKLQADRIQSIIHQSLITSENPTQTMQGLNTLFMDIIKWNENGFIRDIALFYHSKLWLNPKQSKITLNDLFEEFQKYDTGIQRREWDFHTFDNYGWLGNVSASPTIQYWIWKYLFSIAVAYSDSWNWTVPKTNNKYDYNWLRVLKEWDTHWQEIAKITYDNKFNFDTAKIIRLVDNKLQLYILTDYFSKSHLIWQYELQSDWNWSLNWCIRMTTKDAICSDVYTLFYDNLEASYDCEWNKMKIEKRPIKDCSNLGIHIQTTINK